MDWASAEWKQALTPLAVQKVNALEEKIEKLQKERQQKQLQYECLELALEKEKSKTEKEKQQTIQIQRELQSLAVICKDFESKQLKLQNEIQSRDSKIKNLEVLLSQSKKENAKLQQLVSDLKDVNCLRENTVLERELKLQKSNEENNSNQSIDNSEIEKSLKQKIAEQDALILELRTNLTLVSKNDELNEFSIQSKTPKAKTLSVTDSPAVNSKNTANVWNGFGSTPAKGNKHRVLGHSDSSSMDSGDEKLMSLQSRLKQLCQELDCQRHNFEASKNAMEMKYKENEATLKADLKYQVQANAELDKELKDLKNKYQQELSQTGKKIDLLSLQLKKTEEAKALIEKDLKSVESKLGANESTLRLKEEQFQDLQRIKNACDVTLQSLQFKLNEFEHKYKILEGEKNSLSENIKAYEMQLEGSNNLVKEKEVGLLDAQRKCSNVQVKMKELENQFTLQEEKLQKCQRNEISLTEQLEFMTQEKDEMHVSLNSEIIKCKSMESAIEEQKQEMSLLKKELDEKILYIDMLKNQMVKSNDEFESSVNELKAKLVTVNEELSILRIQLQESLLTETSLKEQVEQLKMSNKELCDSLNIETDTCDCLKHNLDELTQKLSSLREEHSSKCLKLEELENQVQTSKKEFQDTVHKLESKLVVANEELGILRSKLQEISLSETSLKEQVEKLKISNKDLLDTLSKETDAGDFLKQNLEEQVQKLASLSEDYSLKCLELEEVKNQMQTSKMQFQSTVNELEAKLDVANEELCILRNKVQESLLTETSLKEQVEQLNISNKELCDTLSKETDTCDCIKRNLDELTQQLSSLREEHSSKCLKLEEVETQVQISKKEFQDNVNELEAKLVVANEELSISRSKLQETSLSESSLKEQVEQLKILNKDLLDGLSKKTDAGDSLKQNLDKQVQKLSSLSEEYSSKCLELEEVKDQMQTSKKEFQSAVNELEAKLDAGNEELGILRKKVQESLLTETSLKEQVELLKMSNKELCDSLNKETDTCDCLKRNLDEQARKLLSLTEEYSSKCLEMEEVANQMQTSKKEFQENMHEMEDKLKDRKQELDALSNQLQESSLIKISLNEKLKQLERTNTELADYLCTERNRSDTLSINLDEETRKMSSLKKELSSKCLELQELNNQMLIEKDQYKNEIQELNFALKFSKDQIASPETELESLKWDERNFKEKIELMEQENIEISNKLKSEILTVQQLKLLVNEKKQECSVLRDKLEYKSLKFEDLNSLMKILITDLVQSMIELDEKLHAAKQEVDTLQIQLQESALVKISLSEKVEQLEKSNKDLLESLAAETNKSDFLQQNFDQETHKMQLLVEELSNKCLALEDVNNQIFVSKNQLESQVQELNVALTSSEDKVLFLEAQLKDNSLNENNKEKLAEQDKLELCNQLNLANVKIIQLELDLEDEKKCYSSLQEMLTNSRAELEIFGNQMKNLNDALEKKIHELEEKFSSVDHKSLMLEAQLQQCSAIEIPAKEQIEVLEKEKLELVDQLKLAEVKVQHVELSIKEEKESCRQLKLELKQKCLELEDLNSKIEILKNEHETNIQELQASLSASEVEVLSLESQLYDISSERNIVKGKLQVAEEQKSELCNQLTLETAKVQELELSIEDEKKVLCLLKEKLAEFEESSMKDINDIHEAVFDEERYKLLSKECKRICDECKQWQTMNQQQQVELSLIEKSFKVKIDLLEKNKKELLEMLTVDKNTFQYFVDTIKTLKDKLSSTQADLLLCFDKMKDHSLIEMSLKGKLDALVSEKKDLLLNLTTKSKIAENLETSNNELNKSMCDLQRKMCDQAMSVSEIQNTASVAITVLQEYLSAVVENQESFTGCESCKDFSKSINCILHQIDHKEILSKLSNTITELFTKHCAGPTTKLALIMAPEDKLEAIISNCEKEPLSTKDEETVTESKLQELSEKLATEIHKNQCLQLELENWKMFVLSLDHSLLDLSSKQEILEKKFANSINSYKDMVKELETKLTATELEYTTLKFEKEKSSLIEIELKQQLDIMINEKNKAIDEVANVTKKFVQLKQEYQNMIKELETKLTTTEQEYTTLKSEMEKSSSNEIELKQQLDIMINEKNNAIDEVANVTNKYVQLQQEYEVRFIELEKKLLDSEMHSTAVELKLKDSCNSEVSLKEKLLQSEAENAKLMEGLVKKTDEVLTLASDIEMMKKELSFMEEKCTLNSANLEALDNKERIITEYERKIEDYESRILIVQTKQTAFQHQIEEFVAKEELLKSSFGLLKKENIEVTNKLKVEVCKSEELELLIQELRKSCASFEAELSLKSLKLEEAERKIIAHTSESRVSSHFQNCNENVQSQEEDLKSIHREGESAEANIKFSLHCYEEIYSLEQDVIAKLETIKFLCYYKLIGKKELPRLWKKFLSLSQQLQRIQLLKKLMFWFQDILKFSEAAHIVKNCNLKQVAILLPERLCLAVQDLFYMCGDASSAVSQILQLCKTAVDLCSVLSSSNRIKHLPVITSTKYILYLHYMSRTYIDSILRSLHQDTVRKNYFKVICIQQELNMKKALSILDVQKLPHFMNYAVALTEYILKPTSNLQPSLLNLTASFPPALHLLKEYLSSSLNLESEKSLNEIKYWKSNCDILRVPECDIVKIISLFECNYKNDKIPSIVPEDLSLEIESLKAEKDMLENALLVEKQRQQLLNATIEEIEFDLGETFRLNQTYKNMILKTSELLTQLKASIGPTRTFLSIKFDGKFSDELCFCEKCIEQEENDENNSHDKLTLCYLFESIGKLIQIGCQLETEIVKCNQTELNVLYKELQDRNSELEMLLANSNVSSKDTHDKIGNLKYELSKEKKNYEQIYRAADQKDILILELELTNSDLSKTVKQYKEKLNSYEEKILKLSADLENLNAVLTTKEEDIGILKKTEEEKLTYENTLLKCKEYESKIQLLYINVSKLEEEKALALSSKEKEINTLKKTMEEKTTQYENIKLKWKECESKIQLLNSVISKSDNEHAVVLSRKEREKDYLKKAMEEKESLYESSQLRCKEYESELQKLNNVVSQLEDQKNIAILCKEEEIASLRKSMEEEALLYKSFQQKCKEYGSEILKLNNVVSQLEDQKNIAILSKEEEIASLRKSMEEQALLYGSIQQKCKEYESKIQLLNSINSKLEEEKALDKHLEFTRSLASSLPDEKNPKETVSELKSKVESLKKSNKDLSFTIESMKKELNAAYIEKHNIEESEKLTAVQNIQLKEEVSNAAQKYICEKQAKEELLFKLKESEKLKVDSDNVINQLKTKNERLDKDVGVLKVVLRDHEKAILNKNSSLKTKDQIIDQLNNKISELEQEKLEFELNLKNVENPLYVQVEDMNKQCSMLKEEIKRLKLVEVKNLMIEENIHELEIQRDALIAESNLLRNELENKSEQLKKFEVENQDLKSKSKEVTEALNLEIALRASLEEESAENQHSIANLNAQLHELKISEEKFKLLNSEQSKENSALKQKIEVLEKNIKEINCALKETREELCHQQQLATDCEDLVEKLKVSQNETKVLISDLHYSKSALKNTTQFITNLLKIIIIQIGSYSDYPDFEKLKSSLTSLLAYWQQDSECSVKSEEKFINEVFDNLDNFYRVQANNHKEEVNIRDHIKSIIDSVGEMGVFCECSVQNPDVTNIADVTNMSVFETTLTRNFSDITQTPHSPRSLLTELQQTRKLLDECFGSLKHTSFKQEQEIESLKMKLSEFASKAISDIEVSKNDAYPYKGKYHLIKIQFKRLEKDYNELVGTCKEMDSKIKTLEKEKYNLEIEKQNLEEEANELAEDVKKIEAKYNSSDELAETLTELTRVRRKLQQSENEKNNLKQRLEFYQPKDEKKAIRNNEGASHVLSATDSKENVQRIDKFLS